MKTILFVLAILSGSGCATQAKPKLAENAGLVSKTKDFAALRSEQIQNIHYHEKIDLTRSVKEFAVESETQFDLASPASTSEEVLLDLENAKISALEINGVVISPGELKSVYDGEEIRIQKKSLKPQDNIVRASFTHAYVELVPGKEGSLGFLRYVDPEDKQIYSYTNLQPDAARQIFPCFDQPSLKGTMAMDVIAPSEWSVIANTRESSVSKTAEGNQLWHFPATLVAPTYVFHLSAGPWASWSYPKKVDGIQLRLFARQSIAKNVDSEKWLADSAKGLHYLNRLYGFKYPFGKLDQVIQPLFMGSMENLGAIALTEKLVFGLKPSADDIAFRGELVFHEMTHMWFGNLVSVQWWDDQSMIEGFCDTFNLWTIRDALGYKGTDLILYNYLAQALAVDLSPAAYSLTRSLPSTEAYDSFLTSFLLRKSALALDRFKRIIGRDNYVKVVRAYIQKYAFGNARAEDFYALAESMLHQDFGAFRSKWYGKPEVAHVQLVPVCDRMRTDQTCQAWSIPRSQTADYAAPELDKNAQNLALNDLRLFRRPIDREALWTSLWIEAHEKKISPELFLEKISAHLETESNALVVHRMLGFAGVSKVNSHWAASQQWLGVILLMTPPDQVQARLKLKDRLQKLLDTKTDASAELKKEWADTVKLLQ